MNSFKGSSASVDILSANYNNGNYLAEFFNSILNSIVKPKSIIFVDDASTDNSLMIAKSFKEKFRVASINFIILELSENIGFGNALNKGLDFVDSECVLRIDPDDIILPDRIGEQFYFLSKHIDIDIVGSNVGYFNSNSGELVCSSNMTTTNNKIYRDFTKGRIGLMHGSVMMRSCCLKQYQYIQSEVPAEDYSLFSRLLRAGFRAENLPNSLTLVRIHMASVSNDLPFSTVNKTFRLRKEIWNIETNSLYVYKEYVSRKLYRKFLFNQGANRYFFLFVAALLNPSSSIKRFLSFCKAF